MTIKNINKKELHMKKIEKYIRDTCKNNENGLCVLTREKMHEITGNSSPVYHMMFRYGVCSLNSDIVMELRSDASNVISSLKMPYTFRVLSKEEACNYKLTAINFRKLTAVSLKYMEDTFSRSVTLRPRLMFYLLYMTDLFLIKNSRNHWAYVDSTMFKNYLCMDDNQYSATLNALEVSKIWVKHSRINNLYRVTVTDTNRRAVIDSANREIDPEQVVYIGQSNNKTREMLTENIQQEVANTIEADKNVSSGDLLKRFMNALTSEIKDEYDKEVAEKQAKIDELERNMKRDHCVFSKMSEELKAANIKMQELSSSSYNDKIIDSYRNKLEESLNNVLDKSIRKMTSTLGSADSNNIDSVINDVTAILMDLRTSLKNVIKTVKPEEKEEKNDRNMSTK